MIMTVKSKKTSKAAEANQNTVSGQVKRSNKRKSEISPHEPVLKKAKFKVSKSENEQESGKPKIQGNTKKGKNSKNAYDKSKALHTAGHSKKWKESKKTSPEKPKLCNLTKKERKAVRQQSKKNFDLAKQLKIIWEELRRDDIKEERKNQLLAQLSSVVKGHAHDLIFAHDTVRVIECLVSLGTDAHRAALFDELKEYVISLCKSRYAKFFMIKILRYGSPEQKAYVMKEFHGKVIHLMKHTEAAVVVETAFNECANAVQRAQLVQEFYGPHFLYFKDINLHNVSELIEAKPDKKTSIIEHMKTSLERVLQKGAHKYSIIHLVLREFMKNADPVSRSDMIECLCKVAAEILHTKDGSRVVMNSIWHGSAKVRKVIVKSFKNHVSKIAQEEFGHMALLAIFDCVDDTRLVEKHIISEIVKDGKSIFLNQYGRKVIAYLVNPRDPLYFHPDVISILNEGANSVTSKKDSELRKSELRNISSPLLLKIVLDNMEDFILDNACSLLVSTLLNHSSGDHTEVFQSLAKLASQPYFPPEGESMHFIERSSSSLLLKKLIAADKGKSEENKNATFSEVLINEIPNGNFKAWIQCNRGAFLLVNLLETEIQTVVKRIKKEMKNLEEILACKTYMGAKILLNTLKKV